MEIVDPIVHQYATEHSSPEDDLLKEIADYTSTHHPRSIMLSGHLQGKVLEMISCMIQPRRILEIGTFTGYSALCLAKGLRTDGLLHTIEIREDDAAKAKDYFTRSKYKDQIILHIGDALTIIDELEEEWDLVFIDADKENYIAYFNRVLRKLSGKGFILADNALFHGQVLEKEVKGKNAKAMDAFNKMLRDRTDVEKVLLPVRDGIFLVRKAN